MKKYGIGDTCYVLEDGQVRRGRISSKKDDCYFIQFVGTCGALQVEPEELYETPEAARAANEKDKNPHVGYI